MLIYVLVYVFIYMLVISILKQFANFLFSELLQIAPSQPFLKYRGIDELLRCFCLLILANR